MARVRHGQDDWTAYHVTTRTLGEAFHLAPLPEKKRILDAIAFFASRGDFVLYGYVIMSNHIHLILQPSSELALSAIVRDFKKWTSRRNQAKAAGSSLWERRYDDNAIRSRREMGTILEYVHQNPVRAGMIGQAEDYEWSSARNYAGRTDVMIEVARQW